MKNTAIIIIDYQNDFANPKGALYVKNAEKLVWNIEKLLKYAKNHNILCAETKDRHPEDHCSFASSHDKPPFTQLNDEMLRPDHCVKNTRWSELYKIDEKHFDIHIRKGTEKNIDAYSWFKWTDLDKILKSKSIKKIILWWVATDYCVNATAIDWLNLWYEVSIITDCIAWVNEETSEKSIENMKSKWVKFKTILNYKL
jgi:nicotinamidase/pyrazinamidase